MLDVVAERLTRADMLQLLLLVFAVLVVVTTFAWPGGGSLANESWFALAPSRNAILALAAAGFGASQWTRRLPGDSRRPPGRVEALATLAALVVWALVTLPIEVLTYAASYPATSFGWSLLVTLLTVPAYFGLGMLLKQGTAFLRLGWLLPLAVPGFLVLLSWLDLQLGVTLFNPWAAALAPGPYPAVAGAATLVTLLALARPGRATAHGEAAA